MAFRISLVGIDHVGSYAEAERFHDKAAANPWRNGGQDHPFPRRRQRHFGVRRTASGNIVFRYHRTDVVAWSPDGSVHVQVYGSQSTCHFIQWLTPVNWVSLHKNGYVVDLNRVSYPVLSDFTITADGRITGTVPAVFALARANREETKRLREEYGYPAFTKWRKVMEPLLTPTTTNGHERWQIRRDAAHKLQRAAGIFSDAGAAAAAIKDQSLWPSIVQAQVTNARLLAAIYDRNYEQAFTYETFETLPLRSESGAWVNHSRYEIRAT